MDRHETRIIIAGFGGQGIVLIGNVIARAAVIEGKNVVGMVSYGAEMRGGTANATVVISSDEIFDPFVAHPDRAIILNQPSLDRFEPQIEKDGLILTNTSMIQRGPQRTDLARIKVDATQIAHQIGNLRVANIVAVGAFIEHTNLLSMSSIEQAVKDLFSNKNPKLVEINLKALHAGAEQSRATGKSRPGGAIS
ncbi:MAG: 2-oxoacid:ferredoxin oxidoreductase subunit gamma [Planctomycetota bacterium]|nr:MAG: 2-oxoacid:ferredoxin oxidoreductase subunit gamma [Planctomycetota bacterium]